MGLICASMLTMRVARPVFPGIWIFAGFASVIAAATSTRSADVAENLFVGTQLLILLGFGSFVLTYNAVRDPKFAQCVSVAFLTGQTLSAGVAVAQLLGSSVEVPGFIYGEAYGRASGLTEHPNTLGLMACIAALITFKISIGGGKIRSILILALVINILGIVASGSITAMLSLCIGFLVLVVCMRDRLGRMALWGLALTTILASTATMTGIISYFPSLTARYAQITGSSGNSSWAARQLTYEYAWDRITESPILGNGLSTQTSGTFNGIITVHNMVLRSWFQGGVFLGVAFAVIVLAMIVIVIRAMIHKECGVESAVIAAILVYGAVSPLFEQRHFWVPLLVAWASISAFTSSRVSAGQSEQRLLLTRPRPHASGRQGLTRVKNPPSTSSRTHRRRTSYK
jgi:O-antigen ligase